MICSLTNHCLHDWKCEIMKLSSTSTLLFGNQQRLANLPFKHCTSPVYKGFWWADISSRVLSRSTNRTCLSWRAPVERKGSLGLPRWGNIFSTHGSVLEGVFFTGPLDLGMQSPVTETMSPGVSSSGKASRASWTSWAPQLICDVLSPPTHRIAIKPTVRKSLYLSLK